jgi:hypothetical protein
VLRQSIVLAPLVMAAAGLSACGGTSVSEMNFFPNRGQLFKSQDWGAATKAAPDLIPTGPAPAESHVDAAGHCAAQATAAPASNAAAGTVAGDLAAPAAPAEGQPALAPGGISLGMTECQVVARAGQPSAVSIGAGEKSERKAVLTFQSGPWPGVYTFLAGRLKVIDRVAQAEPAKKKGSSARRTSRQ